MSQHRLTTMLLIAIFIFPLISGCHGRNQTLESWQVQDWKKDIDYLATELPEMHVNLFNQIDRSEFEKQINQLETALRQMNEDEVRVQLQKIVASVGDGHTTTKFNAKEMYPLDLAWFADGWYVINTDREYQRILYSKLVKINGYDIDKVTASIAGIISHDNDSWVKAQGGYYLTLPAVLHGLHIIDKKSGVPFTFCTRSGENLDLDLKPIDGTSVFERIIGKGPIKKPLPLYMQNSDKNYWYQYLPESSTLYFKYNQCAEMEDKPIQEFSQEIMQLVKSGDCKKMVIDLRTNQGGSSNLFDGLISQLAGSRLNREGSLYVIIGKRTFSAAVLDAVNLKMKTQAILLGEPTGGKPNHFGQTSQFRLPNSKISVSYSTKYFEPYADKNAASLIPDQSIDLNIDDYVNGVDPVMNFISRGEEHE